MGEVLREEVTVDRSPSAAWAHLAHLERWPTWAGHIKLMEPDPPGDLTAATQVVVHMRAGPRNKMTVTEYDPPRRWVWEGKAFGVTTRFEHEFEALDENRTRIWFLAWVTGPLSFLPGRIFGMVMRRNLARALPKLRSEIEASNP